MSERKLATIRMIDAITPIEGADAIEVATVGGWAVVVKKGEFTPGDLAVYFEIDSWIPTELAPFLSKGAAPREYMGIKGERLRTIKLRGQLSQGLLIHLDAIDAPWKDEHKMPDTDVTEFLGIVKYEPPLPAQLAGQARGTFPSFIQKTDQERVQNLTKFLSNNAGLDWEVTEKLDGSSMTVYFKDGDIGVCSRNLDLKETEGNSFWQVARKQALIDTLTNFGMNIALQGELVGPGIQGNRYGLSEHKFFLFDVFDIDEFKYFSPWARRDLCNTLNINHVPVINNSVVIGEDPVQNLLIMAEGKSTLNGCEREGLVFKCNCGQASFKAISNKFLLNGGE